MRYPLNLIGRKTTLRVVVTGLLLGLLLPVLSMAQSKKELEDKRKKIIRDIAATGKMLQKTTRTKEATYDRYLALQNQIESRKTLIQTISAEMVAADEGVGRNMMVIGSLQRDIEKMQEEYGQMVRGAYRRKMMTNPLLFILSADNLNQAFRRWLFLRKYDRFRKQQAEAIAFTKAVLARRTAALEETRQEKEQLLRTMQGQQSMLTTELVEKDAMVKTLAKDETRLKTDLEKKEVAHEALNQSIERVIQEEIRKQVEAARNKPAPAPTSPAPPVTPKPQDKTTIPPPVAAKPEVAKPAAPAAEDAVSAGFRTSKGKMPWPVEDGFVTRTFGRQNHPTLKNIQITNNGIDIRTEESAAVQAIFAGRVAGVQFIPGHDYTVIIQHGTYYTVYSNLSETSLRKDQEVQAKQNIGRVSDNAITGSSELHFELWHQKERLNPSAWIRKN